MVIPLQCMRDLLALNPMYMSVMCAVTILEPLLELRILISIEDNCCQ